MKKRKTPSIGAGSMADVAFLLLVFFLVATTIQTDTGLNITLPPWSEEIKQHENQNVLSIQLNVHDKLLVEGQEANISSLRTKTERFILHEAETPQKAIISIQNDLGTSYNAYLSVFNEIKAGYNKVWDDVALKKYGQRYKDLKEKAQNSILQQYPFVVSEAEPSDFVVND